MFVDRADGCYLFLRDPWLGGATIPVYGCSDVRKWWTVEVSGAMTTISGYRVLMAQSIRVYTDSKMRPCPPYPKGLYAPWEWPYMANVPIQATLQSIPPPPSSPPPGQPIQLDPVPGTIAWAKVEGDTVALSGKVVTAVFSQPYQFFYIQEPDDGGHRPQGIKVVPQSAVTVQAGDEVSVTGTVVGGSAVPECYISASSVRRIGILPLPRTIGLTGRSAAAGEFGLQQALYLSAPDPSPVLGCGLSPVGSRVRVWGHVSDVSGQTCWLDDGSGLLANSHTGLKTIYCSGTPPQANTLGHRVSGILGAESADQSRAVPLVRLPCQSEATAILHVVPCGDDTANGLTWETAKKTIQAGIDACPSGGEVWVRHGTYYGGVYPKEGTGLYGGFAGDETVRAERDPRANKTIIDALYQGSWPAVMANVGNARATIDGFVIRHGPAGGIFFGFDAHITNNVIISNNGPGISCENSSVLIANNTITQNGAMSGAGIDISGGTVTITGNTISGNAATSAGGGIYCHNSASVVITNNTIRANTAAQGAGVSLASSASVRNNVISGNTATTRGGGVYVSGGTVGVCNNTVTNNAAPASAGGGIYCLDSSPTIANNIVAFNSTGMCGNQYSGSNYSNCVVSNTGGDYCGNISQGTGDITGSIDIEMAPDGYHIQPGSPCRDAGNANAVQAGDVDIDWQPRASDGLVDMGADESSGSTWYALDLSASPVIADLGETITVTATVTDAPDGTRVYFRSGAGSFSPSYADTANEQAQSVLSCSNDCKVIVTGCIVLSGGERVEKQIEVWFYDPAKGDWPMFMHDPQHTGFTDALSIRPTQLEFAWAYPHCAAVLTASTVRESFWSDHPRCLDSYLFQHPYIDSSPAVAGGKVVVGTWTGSYFSCTGDVRAFDAYSGSLVWVSPSMGGVASTACVFEDRVLVGSADGRLYCLALHDGGGYYGGDVVWYYQTTDRSSPAGPSRILASPVVDAATRTVYIGNEAAKVYAITVDTGQPVDSLAPCVELPIASHGITQLSAQNMTGKSSPAIANLPGPATYAVVGCDDGYLYRIRNLGSGNWDVACLSLGCPVESSPAVCDGYAYVGVSHFGASEVFRVALGSLVVVDQTFIGEECRATPALGFGSIFVGVDTGNVFHRLPMCDLGGAHPYFSAQATEYFVGSAALVSGGAAVVGNDNGNVYILDSDRIAYYPDYFSYWLATIGQQTIGERSTGEFVCSSPAVSYNVDTEHNMWVFVTSRQNGGRLWAFKATQLD
jgi:parallel beta-helix repeat protein